MGGIGAPEILIVLAILLLLFGAKKLPELARGLGQAQREFKKGAKEGFAADDDVTPAPAPAPPAPPAPTPPAPKAQQNSTDSTT